MQAQYNVFSGSRQGVLFVFSQKVLNPKAVKKIVGHLKLFQTAPLAVAFDKPPEKQALFFLIVLWRTSK